MNFKSITLLLLFSVFASAINPQLTLDWKYRARASITGIETADLDGDGILEILASSNDGYVYALNSSGNLLWRVYSRCQMFSVKAEDITGDGKPEVLAGGCRHLQIIDNSGSEMFKYHVGLEIHDIDVSDLDGDGIMEIVMIAHSFSGSQSSVSVVAPNGQTLWRKDFSGARIRGLALADVNGDGNTDILVAGRSLVAYDRFGRVLWSVNLGASCERIVVSDDGRILVGASNRLFIIDFNGNILKIVDAAGMVFDVADFEGNYFLASASLAKISKTSLEKSWSAYDGQDFTVVVAGDIDGFGSAEVVAGGKSINVFGLDGGMLWDYSPYLSVSGLKVVDVDGDGFKEVIAGARDFNVYYVKHTTSYIKSVEAERTYMDAVNLKDEGRIDDALEFALKSVSINPSVEKYVFLRDTLLEMMEYDAAETEFRIVFSQAQSFAGQNRFEQALEYAERALNISTSMGYEAGVRESFELIGYIEAEQDRLSVLQTTTTLLKSSFTAGGANLKLIAPVAGLLTLFFIFILVYSGRI